MNTKFKLNKVEEVQYYTSPLIESTGFVKHFFSTRKGGVSEGFYKSLNLGIFTNDLSNNIDENFKRILKASRMENSKITYLFQVHGNRFYFVDENNFEDICGKDGDAIITSSKEIALGVFTADCVPIILVDTKNKVVAVVHAGWKGTYQGTVEQVIKFMIDKMKCNAENIIAALGPAIGPCCFEVGEEVAKKFSLVTNRDGKYFVDLWSENKEQILKCGVKENNIEISNLCTMCNDEMFFSYRRDNGKTGRLGTFVEMV